MPNLCLGTRSLYPPLQLPLLPFYNPWPFPMAWPSWEKGPFPQLQCFISVLALAMSVYQQSLNTFFFSSVSLSIIFRNMYWWNAFAWLSSTKLVLEDFFDHMFLIISPSVFPYPFWKNHFMLVWFYINMVLKVMF